MDESKLVFTSSIKSTKLDHPLIVFLSSLLIFLGYLARIMFPNVLLYIFWNFVLVDMFPEVVSHIHFWQACVVVLVMYVVKEIFE